MSRKGTKRGSPLKRTLRTAVLLGLIYIILYLLTPSVASYYENEPESVIASLELPMLEEDETLIIHTGYSLVYDEEHEQAKWVAYHLTRDELYGLYERKDDFRSDESISTGSAELDDYRRSGYDRGHLIPAADASWSEQAMSETFFLSNMSPQEPSFNRGIWADLEATVRHFADSFGSVYVTTGPLYERESERVTIGDNEVTVPDAYFKAILTTHGGTPQAIAFILANEKSSRDLEETATSIDLLEDKS